MKIKRQIQNRLNILEFNNSMVRDEKGHELNQVRIDELILILSSDKYNLHNKLEEFKRLNKFKKDRKLSVKITQIEWALKDDGFTKLEKK